MSAIVFNKLQVIARNEIAIEACNVAIAQLDAITGLGIDLNATRLDEITRAENLRNRLETINENLRASTKVVQPLPAQLVTELNDLGNKLDQQIRNDAMIGASIDFITSVLNDVNRLRSITRQV